MAKRTADLRQAMLQGARTRAPDGDAAPAEPPPPPSIPRNRHYRPGRESKTNVTAYFPPVVKKQLRLLAAEEETTIQELLAEALNDLFAKRGRPEIAPLSKSGGPPAAE